MYTILIIPGYVALGFFSCQSVSGPLYSHLIHISLGGQNYLRSPPPPAPFNTNDDVYNIPDSQERVNRGRLERGLDQLCDTTAKTPW